MHQHDHDGRSATSAAWSMSSRPSRACPKRRRPRPTSAKRSAQAVFLESVRLPDVAINMDLPEDAADGLVRPAADLASADQSDQERRRGHRGRGLEAIKESGDHGPASGRGRQGARLISDNGKGWPKENRHRLLEPYVTTREKGTGLGLAIVARIIEQHGGTVELIDAEPDPRTGASAPALPSPCRCNSDDEPAETVNDTPEAGEGATQRRMTQLPKPGGAACHGGGKDVVWRVTF